MPPLLQAENLVRLDPKTGRRLLYDVSLSVAEGELVTIAGPSGSGKTLLLRSLALLDRIDAGSVVWRGKPAASYGVPVFRSQAIYLHQRASLLAETVEEALNIPFQLAIRRREKWNRAFAVESLARFNRDESFLLQKTGDLSGGERQIVALIRALQLNPTLLLLDEPTSALDPQASEAAETLLTRWLREKSDARAILWITHDADQAERVAGRRLFMSQGELLDSTPTETLQ